MSPSLNKSLETRHVFIGSPRDLAGERRLFPDILARVNRIKGNSLGIELKPLGWEDALPGFGRPQELINEDVKKADPCVMLLWKRWGTPTGKYSSGFEEEFKLARKLYKAEGSPEMWLFFRAVPQEMMADPGEQLSKVLKFRKRVEKERSCLFKGYEDVEGWEKSLVEYLCDWLDGHVRQSAQQTIEFPPEALERIKTLEDELSKIGESHLSSQQKLRKLALDLTQQGVLAGEAGHLTEAEQAFASAVEAYPEPEAINSFGLFLRRIGSLDRAEEKFQQLETLSHQLSEKSLAAKAYGNLGIIYKTRGDLEGAEDMYHKALAIDKELGSKEGMAAGYGNLGVIYKTRGDLDRAEEMYRQALSIDEELGSKEGMATDYGNLGVIYKTRGELDRAEEMHRKSLAIDEDLGSKEGMATGYGNLGNIYQTRGDLDRAEKMHRKSLAIEEELGRKEGIAANYGNLGNIYLTMGDLEEAEEMRSKALALFEEVGAKPGMEKVRNLLSELRNKE